MDTKDFVWLAADYHFPTSYSCRVPMSSQYSALAMPAPGPATIRLAMIRTGIEVFGKDYVQNELFPVIRSAEIEAKPPAKVAISTQLMHAYKAKANGHLQESLAYREVCQADGVMTVYIRSPINQQQVYRQILAAIGYWGQANSLTSCVAINQTAPQAGDCARPLKSLPVEQPLGQFFSCIASEFRDDQVEWDEIMPIVQVNKASPIRLDVYVWPLIICEQHSNGKRLIHRSLLH